MATIKSETVKIDKPLNEVFDFLRDLNNLEKLMPHDRIDNWESTAEECRFTIKGLAGIGMEKTGEDERGKIRMTSKGKNPFDFVLDVDMNEVEGGTEAQLIFDGKMNPFMKAMVDKPLKNFFNHLASQLKSQVE
ncbi:MAG TPA: hypothetical protein DDX92_09125 [Flavobacteriales bacterium]|jgi:carbon monoxide dehydrogenase subunit G|nr:hypothetical protein [Flavobacteriales bacterium]